MNIADFLGYGAENAIPAVTLAAIANVTPRELRRQIMVERDSGSLILYTPGGSKAGYYLPSKDPKQAEREVDAFYRVQRARCLHGLKAIAAARAVLEYGLRLIEANDFEQRLRALEERSQDH